MQILADADALPGDVKRLLYKTAERYKVQLILVANQCLRLPKSEYISGLNVPPNPDAADDLIAEMVQKGDLVITQDIPLADRVVTNGGTAITPRGIVYTDNNVKEALATRDLMDSLRKSGMQTGGPSVFSDKNWQNFCNQLDKFMVKNRTRSL